MEGIFPTYTMRAQPPGSDAGSENVSYGAVVTHPDPGSLEDVANKFRVTFAFITVFVATIGNGLTLAVMHRKSMRGTAAGVYLSAIAVADSWVVYFGQIPAIVGYFRLDILVQANLWKCSFRFFLLFTMADLAVWLIVALTLDRFIAVWLPHRAKTLCTVRRAGCACAGLAIMAVVKNLSLVFARTVTTDPMTGQPVCGYVKSLEYYQVYVRPWIAFTLYAFIPIVTVFVLNLLIIQRLWKVHRAVKKNSPQQGEGGSGRSFAGSSLTAMFLCVSIVFLLLLTPGMLNYAMQSYRTPTPASHLVTSILDSLSYINHSINFFLYCLTARRFRAEFLALVGGLCGRRTTQERSPRDTTADMVTVTNLA